ncbi:MAG: SRPBCC domain-containing protein [Cyclobacteriaceae bacterium]|nr:SRPBCC domain-containing protein [Cyclobacteriaceae bacterium]
MNNSSWSVFTKRIPVKASVEQIYRAWATQEGLEQWFLRSAIFTSSDKKSRERTAFIQKGDTFTWHWHGYPDTVFEKREVIDANGKDQIQFTFSGDCLVTVTALPIGDITICELTQENIPSDNNPSTNLYIGCGEGWTFYLANLKSILEGGVDLRNKDNTITKVINS